MGEELLEEFAPLLDYNPIYEDSKERELCVNDFSDIRGNFTKYERRDEMIEKILEDEERTYQL